MKAVAAVFKTRSEADEGVAELRSLHIPGARINLLTPDATKEELARIPKTEANQAGVMKVLGGVVGGMTGFAGGYELVALLIPGVGLVLAFGVAGGIILGAIGAITGEHLAGNFDSALTEGLPDDELFFYEDALRQGRSLVIATLDDDSDAEAVRGALEEAGAESIDQAHKKWWLGIRDIQKEHYQPQGGHFEIDEVWFRRGFETALEPHSRGKSYQDSRYPNERLFPSLYDEAAEGAFRRGYQRGQAYRRHREA